MNNVVVLDNPSPFYNPFQFEITFECIEDLSEGESRRRRPPRLSVAAADVESFPGPASRERPAAAPGGLRLASAEGNLKLMDDGRRGARRSSRSPGACRGSTCEELVRAEVAMLSALSGGREGGSRDPHSRPRRRPGLVPGWPHAASCLRDPRGQTGLGEVCVWSPRRVSSGAILPQ